MNLSEKIQQKLQEEKIKAIPRGYFMFKEWSWRFLLLLTLIVGSQAVGLLMESLFPDSQGTLGMGHGFVHLVLGWLPLIWLVFLMLILLVAVLFYRRLRLGYRLRFSKLIFRLLTVSLLFGFISFQFNLTPRTHHFLMWNVPMYKALFEEERQKRWNMPLEGRLAGEVLSVTPNHLILRGFDSKVWKISFDSLQPFSISPTQISEHQKLKIHGVICGSEFCALRMNDWNSRGMKKP